MNFLYTVTINMTFEYSQKLICSVLDSNCFLPDNSQYVQRLQCLNSTVRSRYHGNQRTEPFIVAFLAWPSKH